MPVQVNLLEVVTFSQFNLFALVLFDLVNKLVEVIFAKVKPLVLLMSMLPYMIATFV